MKKTLVKVVFFKKNFLGDFSTGFRRFLREFPIFLSKRISALKFPLNAAEYYANNSVLSVERIKLMPIIEEKGQNGRR